MKLRTTNVLTAAALLVAMLGCSNRKTPVPGKECRLNSDCENPLSCNFGKCHEACRADGDCQNGGLCVFAPAAADAGAVMSEPDTTRARVCVSETCALNSQCPTPLVCGRDLRCRQECAEKRDCPSSDQLCVTGNDRGQKVCAQAIDIGDNGQLSPADGGAPAVDSGAPANDGGAPAVDGGNAHDAGDASGLTGDAGSILDANDVSGSDASVSDVSVATDAPADPPPADGAVASHDAPAETPAPDSGADAGPIVVTEREPNDDINSPTTYVVGTEVTGSLGSADGSADLIDYYEVVAPPGDPSGGYFQASVSGVGSGAVFAAVYSAFDNGQLLLADGAQAGQATFFYWAARPGQHYLVRLYEGGGVVPTFAYTFKATYTRIADELEPNDNSDTPAALALGTPATAYFFAGFDSANPPVPDQDWYAVTLTTGGNTRIGIQPVPHDLRMQIQVYDSRFTLIPVTGAVGANPGAAIDAAFTATQGTYRIAISAFSFVAGSVAGRGVVPPDSFTRPYMITVTQP